MDINWIYEQAKQKGLDAINSIKSTTTPQQPTPRRTVPLTQLGIKPIYEPMNFKSVVSIPTPKPTLQMSRVTTQAPQMSMVPKATVSLARIGIKPISEPLYQPLTFQAYPGAKEFTPKPLPTRGYLENAGTLWNDFTNNLSTNLLPAIQNLVKTSAEAGVAPSFGGLPGTPGFIEAGAKDIALLTKPEQAAAVRGAEADIRSPQYVGQAALSGLELIALPGLAFNKTYVNPIYLNNQLDKRATQTGVPISPEERLKALNSELTTNQIWNNKEGTTEYLIGNVTDFAVSLIEPSFLFGLGKLAIKGIPAATTAFKMVKNTNKLADIAKLALKGNIPEIEKTIGRSLTVDEVAKVTNISQDANAGRVLSDIENVAAEGKVLTAEEQIANAKKISDSMTKARVEAELGGKRTLGQQVKEFWSNYKVLFETQADEMFQTVSKIEKKLGGELKPSENPLMFLDVLYKSSRQAELYAARNGFFDIIKDAAKLSTTRSAEEFGNFLEARRLLTLESETGYKLTDPAKTRALYEGFAPRYNELAARYDKYMSGLLEEAYNGGLINAEEFARINQLKDYTPLYKIQNLTDTPDAAILSKRTIGTVSDPKIAQQLERFEESVSKNPIEASLYYTYRVQDQLNKNRFASVWGDLIRQGKVEGAYMVRNAADVIARQNILNDIEELKKVQSKINNFIKKKNIQKKMIEKEVNALSRKGIRLAINKTTQETIDPILLDRLNQKIKVLTKDRNKLVKDLKKLELKDLDLQENKAYFGFEDGLPKPQVQEILDRRVVNKEQFLVKTLFKTDALVKEKVTKYLNKNYGLFFNKMTDKELLDFFRTSSVDELETFVELAFDLKPRQYDSFIKKLNASQSKEAQILLEIDDAKNAAFTNKIVTALYKNEEDIIKKFVGVSDQLNGVLSDINRAKSNIYYNELFKSLVRKSPEQLDEIYKALGPKEKNLRGMIEIINDSQKNLDEVSGAIKARQQEEKLLRDASKEGKTTISWYKDGVKEIAVVPKRLAEGFSVNTDSELMTQVLDIMNLPARLFKVSAVGAEPVSILRQTFKDQTALLFFTAPRVKLSVLNPANFSKALYGVTTETPEYLNYLRLGGGSTSYDVYGGTETVQKFVKQGGKTQKFASLKNFEQNLAKAEQASRFELYTISKKYYLENGYSLKDAELKAVYDSNNILPNYFQKGKLQKVFEFASPFLTAKIKSGRALREQMVKNPLGTTAYLLANYALPIAGITYWNMSSPERKAAYKDIPEYEKTRGPIILPTVPVKDEKGKWIYFAPPIEESIYGLTQGWRRATEYAMDTDEQSVANVFGRYFSVEGVKASQPLKTASEVTQSITGQTIPVSLEQVGRENVSAINPLIRGPFEVAGNYDFFKNGPIENLSDRGVYPEQRFDEKTTQLAIDLGQSTKLSPKMIDHVIKLYFPGLGEYAVYGYGAAQAAYNNDPRTVVGKNPLQQLQRILIRESGGQTELNINKQVAEDRRAESSMKQLLKEAIKNNDAQIISQLAPNLTYQEFRALETAVQKETVKKSLPASQQNLYDLSNEELAKVLAANPQLQETVDGINQAKLQVKASENLDTSNLNFKAATPSAGGVSRPKTPRAIAVKGSKVGIGKTAKPKKLAIAKPKKLKVKKTAKPKKIKIAKLKPIKVTRKI